VANKIRPDAILEAIDKMSHLIIVHQEMKTMITVETRKNPADLLPDNIAKPHQQILH
jgi:hypothetical protein